MRLRHEVDTAVPTDVDFAATEVVPSAQEYAALPDLQLYPVVGSGVVPARPLFPSARSYRGSLSLSITHQGLCPLTPLPSIPARDRHP